MQCDFIIDFKQLGETLANAGLTGLPVNQYSKDQIKTLVAACCTVATPVPPKGAQFTKPYITEEGELVIPFDSDPKYQYWKPCGQSLFETLRELKVSEEIWNKYVQEDCSVPF